MTPRLRHAAYLLFQKLAGLSRRLGGPIPLVRLRREHEFDIASPAFVDRARRGPLLVQGWLFRDYPSLGRHGDEIREFFRPHQRYLDEAAAAVAAAREGADVLVDVHVRRGDYRTWRGGRHFWPLRQYAEVMHRTAALFCGRRVSFLVCSDEGVDELDGARGPGHPVSDLCALAGCDYLVGPPSTYSSWASFWGRVPLRMLDVPRRRSSSIRSPCSMPSMKSMLRYLRWLARRELSLGPVLAARRTIGITWLKYGKPAFLLDVNLREGFSSKVAVDVLIPAGEADAEVLPYTIQLIRAQVRHPIGEVAVVAAPSGAVAAACANHDCRLVDERGVVPVGPRDIRLVVNGIDRSAWIFQQLLKLAASFEGTTSSSWTRTRCS